MFEQAAPPPEAPAPEEALLPPVFDELPTVTGEPQAPPAYEQVPPAAPPAYEPAPPAYETPPAYEQAPPPAPPAYEAPPVFEETGVPPRVSEGPPPAPAPYEEPLPEYGGTAPYAEPPAGAKSAPAGLEQMPEDIAPWDIESVPSTSPGAQPSPGEPPVYAPAAEEEKPFDTNGIMEQVRPEASSPDDFRLPPEYQELMGERPVDHEESGEAQAPPAYEAGPAPAPTVEEPPGAEWPFDEVPSTPEAPAPGAGPEAQAQPAMPQDVDLAGEEEEGVTVEDGSRVPPAGTEGAGELNSFFFEDDVEKKGQDRKKDPDSFWE